MSTNRFVYRSISLVSYSTITVLALGISACTYDDASVQSQLTDLQRQYTDATAQVTALQTQVDQLQAQTGGGTYTAGTGLTLSDSTFSADQSQVEVWATDAVAATGAYVTADTGMIEGDLMVGGLVEAGSFNGSNLVFRRCEDTVYNCTPRECLDLCVANGERMAFVDEVYAWASQKQGHCAFMWMLDRNVPDVPVWGYPMYHNRTTSGCGRLNTGDIPRIEGYGVADSWDVTAERDCACAGIK